MTDVFNYDLPIEPENYVHRIGRTARAGTEVALGPSALEKIEHFYEILSG